MDIHDTTSTVWCDLGRRWIGTIGSAKILDALQGLRWNRHKENCVACNALPSWHTPPRSTRRVAHDRAFFMPGNGWIRPIRFRLPHLARQTIEDIVLDHLSDEERRIAFPPLKHHCNTCWDMGSDGGWYCNNEIEDLFLLWQEDEIHPPFYQLAGEHLVAMSRCGDNVPRLRFRRDESGFFSTDFTLQYWKGLARHMWNIRIVHTGTDVIARLMSSTDDGILPWDSLSLCAKVIIPGERPAYPAWDITPQQRIHISARISPPMANATWSICSAQLTGHLPPFTTLVPEFNTPQKLNIIT